MADLLPGHETTASALVWGTHLLTKHPEAGRKLQAEVSSLLRRSPTPSYREIESLPYLNNFSRELLRVECPAIHAPRVAIEDVVIQGVRLPKGTTVLMYPAVVQHNPTIWGPDCDEFDPDRWDRLEGEAANPQAFAAFMQGPRVCIGKAMTMIELKVILVELVSKFRFEAIEQVETQEIQLVSPSALLRPKGGLKVKVARIEE
jgi:cytochrome P450